MSKKISKQEFLFRFYRNYPNAKIKLLNYTAISKPLKIRCVKCGKIHEKQRARDFLNSYNCCDAKGSIRKIDILKKIYDESTDWNFIKQIDKDHLIIHHAACGQDLKRTIFDAFDNPFACKYCNTHKTSQMLSIQEVQKEIDNKFFGSIQILDYNGQLQKNHYKCLKCGLIFVRQQTCLMQSRGCPKCDKRKSNGEKKLRYFLTERNINFKEQVAVSELPLQHFDFGVYDDNDNLLYFIEVQGEQRREERSIFRDSLAKIQERDERKRQYCRRHGIPLYELIYQKGEIKNLDILPIGSTTISAKESTL